MYGGPTSGPLVGGNRTFGFGSNIQELCRPVLRFLDQHQPRHHHLGQRYAQQVLDLSGFTQDAVINLAPGTFSSAGGKTNNIGIAFGTRSSRLPSGGSGNDTILGTNLATSRGGAGNDLIVGGGGNDSIWGDSGNDVLSGGIGADIIDPGTRHRHHP